jgi:hypothetical protein
MLSRPLDRPVHDTDDGDPIPEKAMSIVFWLGAAPLGYLAILGWLAMTGRRQGLLLSLALFAATGGAGYWSITQSRSSTAAIGLLFLPMLATTSGLLALAYARLRSADDRVARWFGALCLLAALGLPANALLGGRRSIALNARRDVEQLEHQRGVERARVEIGRMMAGAGERGGDSLSGLTRRRLGDRDFLIAALERPELSTDLLDTLARSPDFGIALQAVRNPSTRAATLTAVLRGSKDPPYFYQALAAHAHTPPELMREIHRVQPPPITGLNIWFAGNPSTPKDVLDDISRTDTSVHVIRALLRNPSVDCQQVRQVAAGPRRPDPRDDDIGPRLRDLEATLCR